MVVYPHVRDPAILEHRLHASLDAMRRARCELDALLAIAAAASYDYALGFASESLRSPVVRERFATAVDDVHCGRDIPEQVFLVLCGLATYMNVPLPAVFDGVATARRSARREPHVQKLWRTLNEAFKAGTHGEIEIGMGCVRTLRWQLRTRRLTSDTYFAIRTLMDITGSLLAGDDPIAARLARERHLLTMTSKRGELYNPAGLLDLPALAVSSLATTVAQPSVFIPVRPNREVMTQA